MIEEFGQDFHKIRLTQSFQLFTLYTSDLKEIVGLYLIHFYTLCYVYDSKKISLADRKMGKSDPVSDVLFPKIKFNK